MSHLEVTHRRSEAYSAFHRAASINRFLQNPDLAHSLGMIDLDHTIWIEWQDKTFRPLALIETAEDTPRNRRKSVKVLKALALMAGIPAFLVLVTEADWPNPTDRSVNDVRRFAMRRIDKPQPQHGYMERTPEEYVLWLVQLRQHQARQLFRNPPFAFEEDRYGEVGQES